MPTDVYPLQLKPIYQEKPWGGRAIASLGRDLPGDEALLIGESWELADLDATQNSAIDEQPRSIITNGPLAGATLHDAMAKWGQGLLGSLPLTPAGDFPLLVKFLDARENLSVQVHPSPQYAADHPDAHLKSEAWYIVDAQPGACIYKGVTPGTTPQQFAHAIESRDTDAVTRLLNRVPVKPGDCHYLPSGTCHALGAGVLVAEVQTPSDTTFRVFDWNRQPPRTLHVDQAMQCIRFTPQNFDIYENKSHIAGMFTTVSHLVQCEHFRIEKVRMVQGFEQEIPYDQPTIWIVLKGRGLIEPDKQATPDAPQVEFHKGQTLLIPAAIGDAKVKLKEDTIWLEVTFPQANPPQIA